MSTTTNPPTPRRCRRIVEVHHLTCQGLSPEQIADQFGCGRSTVYAYLRDFQLHRSHVLQSVAADQLADQIHRLNQPGAEADQHRQTVAAARELRLLLLNLPAIQEHEQQQREHARAAATAAAEARERERDFETRVDAEGHHRYIRGPGQGQCTLDCPACLSAFDPSRYELPPGHPDEPAPNEPEPEQSSSIPDESGPIQTNLDKTGRQIDEHPVPDGGSARQPTKSRPQRPSWPRNRRRRDDPDALNTIDIITIDTQILGQR